MKRDRLHQLNLLNHCPVLYKNSPWNVIYWFLQSHRDKVSNRSSSLSIITFHGVIKTSVALINFEGWLDISFGPGQSGPLRAAPTLTCNILYKTHLETTSLDLQCHRDKLRHHLMTSKPSIISFHGVIKTPVALINFEGWLDISFGPGQSGPLRVASGHSDIDVQHPVQNSPRNYITRSAMSSWQTKTSLDDEQPINHIISQKPIKNICRTN